MKIIIVIFTFCIVPSLLNAQQLMDFIESMKSTYNFEGDTVGAGTCFVINKDSKQYFVTAAHLFRSSHKSGDAVPIKLLVRNELESYDAHVYFHKNRNVDMAVMKLSEKVSQGPGISLENVNVIFGDQVFFYGFPLTNLGTEVTGIKFPLVKRATISGLVKVDGVDVIVLDGHNNHGFSGGPVVAYDSSKKMLSVIGIISGYLLETRNVKSKDNKVELAFDENSGIILCYGKIYIEEILQQINTIR